MQTQEKTSGADTRTKLFADTVARFDAGQWHLMNRQDRGWGERSMAFNSLLEIAQEFDVRLGERGTDKHGDFIRVLVGRDSEHCMHRLSPPREALQRNALRVETMAPTPRCANRPKRDMTGKPFQVLRWIGSGGDPAAVALACVGRRNPNCPLSSSRERSNG